MQVGDEAGDVGQWVTDAGTVHVDQVELLTRDQEVAHFEIAMNRCGWLIRPIHGVTSCQQPVHEGLNAVCDFGIGLMS